MENSKSSRSTTEGFFDGDSPHGMMKRILYKKYVQAYIPMTKGFERTLIYDGFAGEGLYCSSYPEANQLEYCGSPLIALRAAIHHFQRQSGSQIFRPDEDGIYATHVSSETESFEFSEFKASMEQDEIDRLERSKITLYFVEGDRTRFGKLHKNVSITFRYYDIRARRSVNETGVITFSSEDDKMPIVCHLLHRKFEQVPCPSVSANERCLAFIDPFGFKMKMKKLAEFAGEGKELLYNFMSSYINRFLSVRGETISRLFRIPLPREVAEQGKKAINRYVEKYVEENSEDYRKRVDRILELFRQRLAKETETAMNLAFEMRDDRNCTKYHMIFVANHVKGYKSMKDTMIRCSQEEITVEKILPAISDYLVNGFQFDLALKQTTEEVADVIYEKFAGCTVPYWVVVSYVTHKTPFIFQKRQLKELEMNRCALKVFVYSPELSFRRRGAFPDHLENFILIQFLDKPSISRKRRRDDTDTAMGMQEKIRRITPQLSPSVLGDHLSSMPDKTKDYEGSQILSVGTVHVNIDMHSEEDELMFVTEFDDDVKHGGMYKSRFTLVLGISAEGDILPVLLHLKGLKNLPNVETDRKKTVVTVEENVFSEWVKKIFTKRPTFMFQKRFLLFIDRLAFPSLEPNDIKQGKIEPVEIPSASPRELLPVENGFVERFKECFRGEFQRWINCDEEDKKLKKPSYQMIVNMVNATLRRLKEIVSKNEARSMFEGCAISARGQRVPDDKLNTVLKDILLCEKK